MTVFCLQLSAQDKMIVDQKGGLTYYGSASKDISAISQLPPLIVNSAQNIINAFMGDFSKNTHFSYGQLVEKKNNDFVSKDHPVNPAIPRYDLEFILTDLSIGIKSLPVNIRLDSSGKPLKVTWPRQGYTNAAKFMQRDSIRAFALKQAANLNFNLKNYQIEFSYDEVKQKFYWAFLFPNSDNQDTVNKFDVIYINWSDENDFSIENIVKTTVY